MFLSPRIHPPWNEAGEREFCYHALEIVIGGLSIFMVVEGGSLRSEHLHLLS
jgi:hypothetical protein